MKVAYVSHFGRPCYEYDWFSNMEAEKIKYIDVDFSAYPSDHIEGVEYCKVDYQENALLKDRFHSTARIIQYSNFEQYLDDVDVVIVLEVFSSLSKQFAKYCKENNKKVVVLVYELIPTHPLHYLPTHVLNRKYTIRNADLFICVSIKAKEALIKLGGPENKIEVVYPGIDLSLFKPSNRKKDNMNLIFVGGLSLHKGIDLILELADELLPKYSDLNLTIVGEGPYKKQVIEYTKKYPNIQFLGRVPNDTLPTILNEHGIFILPCRDMYKYGIKITSEQFGFSFVEAMACGLGVITADCGAIPEIVTDANIVCPQGSSTAFIDAVKELLSDKYRLRRMQSLNVEIAKSRYDIVSQGRVLSQIISENNF